MRDLINFLFVILVYLAPFCVARLRKHNKENEIFLLNAFLGWTIIGWIVALIWASGVKNATKPESAATEVVSKLEKKSTNVLFFALVLVAMAAYVFIGNKIEEKDQRVKSRLESERRAALTVEQRQAEDEKKAAARRLKVLEGAIPGARQRCISIWTGSLRDPDSAKIESLEGGMVGDTEYALIIIGRAKNGFGGYVRSSWLCRMRWDGKVMHYEGMSELN